ncbi:unnamed protein product [Macrosiphum euphorbiae]|uniref:CCHC-type domain-containing protein n=1 Tax=Macrosiphum euphorbiae TaxID=13131 RepID=A0AAV0Y7K0_9HEMI|nr:unnamed protein product [Macrosiphum euphorbiae]
MEDSSSGTTTDAARTTLADKLIASGSNAQMVQTEKLSVMSEKQLHDKLENMEKVEGESFDRVGRRLNTMLEAIRVAKSVAKPVQTALAEAVTAFNQATNARKLRQKVAERLKAVSKDAPTTVAVEDTLDAAAPVLAEIRSINSKLNDYGVKIEALTASIKGDGNEAWTEVARKRSGPKQKTGTSAGGTLTTGDSPGESTKQRARVRPAAIMIDVDNQEEFPALAQKIKSGINVGDNITSMRKTKSGGLLLEVRGDQSVVDTVRSEVARVSGDAAHVRLLLQRSLVEIRDIDSWSCKEDISGTIARDAGIPEVSVNVVSLRSTYGGSQTALVLLPMGPANGIITRGRIKISVVSCRVRLAERRRARCFNCCVYDHEAKDCKGIDRRKCCRRCGESGHFAKACEAAPTSAAEFRKKLESEALGYKETQTVVKQDA